MIKSDKYRDALVNTAKKLSKVQQDFAKSESGAPIETYLQYLSLLYDEKAAEIIQYLDIYRIRSENQFGGV